jgi:hypothetical protein
MACSWYVSCFLDAPAGSEASSIRPTSWIGTTVKLTIVKLRLQLTTCALTSFESAVPFHSSRPDAVAYGVSGSHARQDSATSDYLATKR